MGLTDKNLYAYCDNNPITRADNGGEFWESILDVISLGASIVEVSINPLDPWAWAGLVGDIVDVAVPFVGGLGEAVDSVKVVNKVLDKGGDVIDAAKALLKSTDTLKDIKNATGSYEILFKSGKKYIGKGGFKRAIKSATEKATDYTDEVANILWKSAPNKNAAFIDEYFMQKKFLELKDVFKSKNSYNKIWSPGRRLYEIR